MIIIGITIINEGYQSLKLSTVEDFDWPPRLKWKSDLTKHKHTLSERLTSKMVSFISCLISNHINFS